MREENLDNEDMNGDENENEDIIYTLIDEDGKESEFVLIRRIDIDGQSYVAFEPLKKDGDDSDNSDGGGEDEDEDEDSFVILKVSEEDGEEIFVTIDDDDEFDRVADIFEDELMQDMDYGGGDEEDEN